MTWLFGPKKTADKFDPARLVISFSQMSSYEINWQKYKNSSTYQLLMTIWSPKTKSKCWKCTGNFDKISFFFLTQGVIAAEGKEFQRFLTDNGPNQCQVEYHND